MPTTGLPYDIWTKGLKVALNALKQLMAMVKLTGLVVVPAPVNACGVVLGILAADGTDKLQVNWGVIGGVAQGKEIVPANNEFAMMTS